MDGDFKLDDILRKYENIIVTMEGCSFCKKAKNLLASKQISYKEFNRNDYRKLSDEITQKYKLPTVPKIFIQRSFIGGCDNLIKYFTEKKQ